MTHPLATLLRANAAGDGPWFQRMAHGMAELLDRPACSSGECDRLKDMIGKLMADKGPATDDFVAGYRQACRDIAAAIKSESKT